MMKVASITSSFAFCELGIQGELMGGNEAEGILQEFQNVSQ